MTTISEIIQTIKTNVNLQNCHTSSASVVVMHPRKEPCWAGPSVGQGLHQLALATKPIYYSLWATSKWLHATSVDSLMRKTFIVRMAYSFNCLLHACMPNSDYW